MKDFWLLFHSTLVIFSKKSVTHLFIFFIFIVLILSSGCIGIPGTHTSDSSLDDESIIEEAPVTEVIENLPPAEIFIPFTPTPTPLISTVADWNPYETLPLPQSIKNRTSILKNDTPNTRLALNITWSGSASPDGFAIGKALNITKGPFAIVYTVHPKVENPLLVWAKLTVSDPWQRIIADDGYNRGYSSEETKTMTVFHEGLYYLTIKGEFATVDYSIKTRDPAPEVTQTPVPEYYEEGWPEGEEPF